MASLPMTSVVGTKGRYVRVAIDDDDGIDDPPLLVAGTDGMAGRLSPEKAESGCPEESIEMQLFRERSETSKPQDGSSAFGLMNDISSKCEIEPLIPGEVSSSRAVVRHTVSKRRRILMIAAVVYVLALSLLLLRVLAALEVPAAPDATPPDAGDNSTQPGAVLPTGPGSVAMPRPIS
eukprot:scpid69303/ scgid18304/ 